MAWLAGMLLPAIAFAVIFQSQGDTDGRLLAANYTVYGVVSALVAGATVLFCVWGTRSVIPRLPSASASGSGSLIQQTLRDFRTAFGNYNFGISIGSNLAFGIAAGVT